MCIPTPRRFPRTGLYFLIELMENPRPYPIHIRFYFLSMCSCSEGFLCLLPPIDTIDPVLRRPHECTH